MIALSAVLGRVTGWAACIARLGWIIAFLAGVQGWTPIGAEWHAGAGRSVWSRCGLAMCSCGPAAVPPAHVGGCCSEAEPMAAHADAGALLVLAALGQERREGSPEVSAPDVMVLAWPASSALEIDPPRESGRVVGLEPARRAARGIEVPAPPPRA
ncbi:MAG: hypothetical protein KJZ54_03625 [Phycisphaerales bacterium]|nr:hypothetical protein [Phycisphaerales bacterium]